MVICSRGLALRDEVASAKRVSVSKISQPSESRFCESAEASHSSHDVTGMITKGRSWSRPVLAL